MTRIPHFLVGFGLLLAGTELLRGDPAPGWGFNGKLNISPPALVSAELADLQAGRVTYLREDVPLDNWAAREPLFRRLNRAGYRVVGLVPYALDPSLNGPDPDAVS